MESSFTLGVGSAVSMSLLSCKVVFSPVGWIWLRLRLWVPPSAM